MTDTQLAILTILFFSSRQGKSNFPQISNAEILTTLRTDYDIDIGLPWLHQCIRDLIDDRYLARRPSYKHTANTQFRPEPSLLKIAPEGLMYLKRTRTATEAPE